ncbi:hypothetical protein [Peribacillus frigoritolerans]|uniref:hypothetical protein n=1 Tax=Peribacillus frigoritolerans TaxID=450367 RepID=UPI00207AD15B|nr:hypothetical protein [Peribacillus frigoritolerans]USK77751.1 hypothetical protein LIT31_26725 [Peribacillus frigoritolerans]
MAEAGSANVRITADDSQAKRTVSGFFAFLKKSSTVATGIASGLSSTMGSVATVAVEHKQGPLCRYS